MHRDTDKILTKLLKEIPLNSPSAEFTGAIMEQLNVSLESDLNADNIEFSNLLKKIEVREPSKNITEAILTTINTKPQISLKPVLNVKVIIGFAAILIALVTLSFFSTNTIQLNQGKSLNFDFLFNQNLISSQDSLFIAVCLISLFTLILFDVRIRKVLFR